jgi:hypothetical protein
MVPSGGIVARLSRCFRFAPANSRFVGYSSRTSPATQRFWFDSDAIIDRRPNPLLAAKVSLGRLNRDMSQQELDLLQFAS